MDQEKANDKKLTKSGINAILAPFRWMVIQGIVLFVSAGFRDRPENHIKIPTTFDLHCRRSLFVCNSFQFQP
ncbi:MAG: hypothetical protein GY950_29315 [bacterium]|nr:hypothetical protein [bacterium]